MSTPTMPTQTQLDYMKTGSAIVAVTEDHSLHDALAGALTDQRDLDRLERAFTRGLEQWDRDVKAHKAPHPLQVTKMAIVADMLSQQYPDGVKHDTAGQITIPVTDITNAWKTLGVDANKFSASRTKWETMVYSTFQTTQPSQRNQRIDSSYQAAEHVGKAIAHSLGVDGIFTKIFNEGIVPQIEVPPLPDYPADDPRAKNLQLMSSLQLELSITEGLLSTITPDEPHEDREKHLLEWMQERANIALETARKLLIPSGIVRFSAQLNDTAKVLEKSRDLLKVCLYGTEADVLSLAAQHAVERSFFTNVFLAIFPNIPFIMPTLELRIAFTKPIYLLTKSAHEALGRVFVFGFVFYLLRGFGYAIDSIPRWQVRFVQNIVTDAWKANPNKRQHIVNRYLRHVERRGKNPTEDALEQVLVSIVS